MFKKCLFEKRKWMPYRTDAFFSALRGSYLECEALTGKTSCLGIVLERNSKAWGHNLQWWLKLE